MNNLNTYIDRCIIEEYATKSITDGYSLSVDDLPNSELSTLVDRVLDSDTELKEIFLNHIQKLINNRIPYVESDSMYDLIRDRKELAA
jgi:hypothetical protein